MKLGKQLLHYAKAGADFLEMADEGRVLALRARARLGQVLSSAQHAEGHLQIDSRGRGVGAQEHPPYLESEPRVAEEDA